MRLPVNYALPLAALVLLGSGGAFAASRAPQLVEPPNGPAADYPLVVGPPFTIGTTVWTPADQLNYDAVGNAVAGEGEGVTAAHKTLPLPCYVEVTSLASGRTILVRIERRGPMNNDALIELSSGASTQLGIVPGAAAVRVRRVNPPEQERALLRAGGRAPDRMETPEGLLKVLRRKLADQSPLLPPPSTPPPMPTGEPTATIRPVPAKPAAVKPAAPKAAPRAKPPVTTAPPVATAAPAPVAPPPANAPPATRPNPPVEKPKPAAPAATNKGAYAVQVAAFSSEASARKVAAQLGGTVSASGKFWRVRLGPYANRAKAAPALEKARGAGYRDARILGAD